MMNTNEAKEYLQNYDGFKEIQALAAVLLSTSPTIDPIRAAGGCYCRECKHVVGSTPKGWYKCRLTDKEVEDDDWCSYGERMSK